MSSRLALALLASLLVVAKAPAQQNARENVRRSKAATAFLRLDRSVATAVCIDPAGIFVTTDHALQFVKKDATGKLLLNPNEDTQREVSATVIRRDPDTDLALIRAEVKEKAPFEFLPLGEDSSVFETMKLTSYGYASRTFEETSKKPNPDINVQQFSVATLSKRDGRLERFDVDARLDPGISGGPVVDATGTLVGIVQRPDRSERPTLVIPVGRLKTVFAKPDLVFNPQLIPAENLYEPIEFRGELRPLLRPTKDLVVELTLDARRKAPRKFVAVREGETRFVIKAAPLAGSAPGARARLNGKVSFAEGAVSGMILDETVHVGGKPYNLSEIRVIQWTAPPIVVFHDGKEVAGDSTRPAKVQVDVGGQEFALDLAKAERIDLQPSDRAKPSVSYTLTVRQGDDVLATKKGLLSISDPSTRRLAGPGAIFARYKGEKKTIELPDKISNVALGGGGRYLLLQRKSAGKISIYDVNAAQIVQELPLSSPDSFLAAGLDKFFVVRARPPAIERWSLATFEKEVAQPLPITGVPAVAAMGYAAEGPLLIRSLESSIKVSRGKLFFIDPQTLKEIPVPDFEGQASSLEEDIHIRASGTGDVFGLWKSNRSPSGLEVLILKGQNVEHHYQHTTAAHVVPSYDGNAIFTGLAGVCTSELNRQAGRDFLPVIPSTHPRFYLSVPTEMYDRDTFANRPKTPPGLYALGAEGLLAQLPELEMETEKADQAARRSDFSPDKRIWFFAEADQVVSIPFSNNRLIVQRFNIRDSVENSPFFYLTSVPPKTFRPGDVYRYQVEAATLQRGLEYKIVTGPQDMTVSRTGEVVWRVPGDFRENRVNVSVSVRALDGQTLVDSFTLRSQ